MYDATLNLRAYQNVELLDNYKTNDDLENYRKKRLGDMKKIVDYIERYIYQGTTLRILEYCSGSSCLLYALEKQGILDRGIGIEISSSRHEFAEKWKADHNFKKVENLNINVKDCELEVGSFDLIIMVDSAFNYFYPENHALPDEVLENSWRFLCPGGFIIFEMMTRIRDRERCKEEGLHTYWIELPQDNPFRFALYRQEILNQEESLILTQNIYIRRDGYIDDSKKEITRVYSLDDLKGLVSPKGFGNFKATSNFEDADYIEGESETLAFLIKKE
jgi:SAM-dependent methyltransferase